MLAPVCVWIALRGEMLLANPADILPAVLLGGAVLTWVAGFDIIYACQDADFDRQAKLKSIPAALGVPARAATRRRHAICSRSCSSSPCRSSARKSRSAGFTAAASPPSPLLLIYEHLLVRPDDLTRLNIAFFNINAVISIGLLIVGAIDLLT